MTTTGFPLQVSFAHQLEKSNLGAIKVWNLEPQTEKKPKKETKSQKQREEKKAAEEKKKKKKRKEILTLTSVT